MLADVMANEMRTALVAVDVQRDFMPGGALAVPDGDKVIAPLVALAGDVDVVIATRDFHPPRHVSFVAQGGQWPDHCVAGTPGAELAPEVDGVADLIVSKGTDVAIDAYSGFDGTDLEAVLKAMRVGIVLIGGLATDYCVKATALDARENGFDTIVITDAVRAVDVTEGDGERALESLRAAGVALRSLDEARR